jgi:small GTP-binding protein
MDAFISARPQDDGKTSQPPTTTATDLVQQTKTTDEQKTKTPDGQTANKLGATMIVALPVVNPVENTNVQKPIKCVLVGDAKAGKTSLVLSHKNKSYLSENIPSTAEPFTFDVSGDFGKKVQITLYDTPSTLANIRSAACADADVFLICFSIDSPTSLKNVSSIWHPEIKQHSTKANAPIFLVGMKSELRAVATAEPEVKRHPSIQELIAAGPVAVPPTPKPIPEEDEKTENVGETGEGGDKPVDKPVDKPGDEHKMTEPVTEPVTKSATADNADEAADESASPITADTAAEPMSPAADVGKTIDMLDSPRPTADIAAEPVTTDQKVSTDAAAEPAVKTQMTVLVSRAEAETMQKSIGAVAYLECSALKLKGIADIVEAVVDHRSS